MAKEKALISASVDPEELETVKAAAEASQIDANMSELVRRVVFSEVIRISNRLEEEEQDAA